MPYMQKLIEGYRRFRDQSWEHERERWAELAEGQNPQVMILSCADSRADPSQIFDARPGEIFVARNIAGLAPPYETSSGFHGVSAALEFAVTQLNVAEILVMGHGLCGGCAAALTGQFDHTEPGEGHFIADWVRMLSEARDQVRARHDVLAYHLDALIGVARDRRADELGRHLLLLDQDRCRRPVRRRQDGRYSKTDQQKHRDSAHDLRLATAEYR